MAGTRHRLFSAVVAAQDGKPAWRAIGEAKLWMHPLSDGFVADYVARHWDSIRWTVGCYAIEGAGVQLLNRVEGNPWIIVGRFGAASCKERVGQYIKCIVGIGAVNKKITKK